MYKDHDGVWKSRFTPALDAIYILLDMNNDDHKQAFTALHDITSRVENDYDNAVKIVQELRLEIFELKKNK
jgi:hypothetical protein